MLVVIITSLMESANVAKFDLPLSFKPGALIFVRDMTILPL